MNTASQHGFYFHHANKTEDYVLMCKWLDEKIADRLPSYADHYVGVGGIVINEKREILLIQEQRSDGKGKNKPWKLPGGYVDHGEIIKDAAVREVLEETGVKSEFVGVVGLREQMEHKYGAADFYMVCLMKPSENQKVEIKDTMEIYNAKWIHLDEITDNSPESEYRLFPNAYKFV